MSSYRFFGGKTTEFTRETLPLIEELIQIKSKSDKESSTLMDFWWVVGFLFLMTNLKHEEQEVKV